MVDFGCKAQLLCPLPNPLPDDTHNDLWLDGGRSNVRRWWSCGLPSHDLGLEN